jgi:transposase
VDATAFRLAVGDRAAQQQKAAAKSSSKKQQQKATAKSNSKKQQQKATAKSNSKKQQQKATAKSNSMRRSGPQHASAKEKVLLWSRCGLVLKSGRGIEVLPRRWVVERTFAWLGRYRRLSKDYEFLPQSSETIIYLAMTRLMLKRLGKVDQVPA